MSVLMLAELEARDQDLLAARETRSAGEYISAVRPCFLLRLLEDEQPSALVYVDADLMFFADPDPFRRELDAASVVLVPQWHSDAKRHLDEVYGIYNAGTIAFRSDADALDTVRRSREQCLEWTGFTPQPGRFGNQRYLNEWPMEQRAVAGALETVGADGRTGLEPPWRLFREVVLRRRVLRAAGLALRRLLMWVRAHGALRRSTRSATGGASSNQRFSVWLRCR